MKRRRFTQGTPLQARLAMFSQDLREKALMLPPGPEKDDLLRRARQARSRRLPLPAAQHRQRLSFT